jgi:Flp pilus assembly protein TadD
MAAEKSRRLLELAAAVDEPDSPRAQLRSLLARDDLGRERALGALSMALRPVPVPFDAGLGDDRRRLRRLAEQADAAAEPVEGLLTMARALRVAGDEPTAERLLRSALRARPQEVALLYELGRLLEGHRPPRWGEAVECYRAARALRPGLGEALANALVQLGRAEEGLALYERLVTERPAEAWLRAARARALLSCDRYREAEAAFREAVRFRPDDASAYANLGVALEKQGRYKEAEADFRQAIRLKPDSAEAHFNLGSVLRQQGREKEAEAAYREALRLRPDHAVGRDP